MLSKVIVFPKPVILRRRYLERQYSKVRNLHQNNYTLSERTNTDLRKNHRLAHAILRPVVNISVDSIIA
jgi:hypothetical protein